MRRGLGLVCVVALAGALSAAPANGGTLDFGPPGHPTIGDFAPVTLTGVETITSVSIVPFSVVDATGSDAGWNVTLTVSDLVNGTSVIPASSMAMPAPVVTPADSASMSGVAAHATAGNLASGEKIVTASAGNGNGTYLVSPSLLTVTIPASAVAGTYDGTATLSVVSGP